MPDSEAVPFLSSNGFTLSTIKSTPYRWVVLLGLSVQNAVSGILWIALAPVTNYAVNYYETSEYVINWINLIYPISTISLGIISAALVDIFGIRFVLIVGLLSNFVCGVFRLASTWIISPSDSLILVIIAQIVASFAQPFCLFAPTKMALVWFPDNQRTTANTISSLANSLGILIGSAFPALLVKKPDDIPALNKLLFGITFSAAILTFPALYRATPLFPPSVASSVFFQLYRRRSERNPSRHLQSRLVEYLKNTALVIKNPGFLMLNISFSVGLAYFSTASALFQQMLCTKGYSNSFAGMCGALMILSGLIVAFFVSLIVDKTGAILFGIKLCFAFAIIGAIGFSTTIWFPDKNFFILLFVAWFGGFGFSCYALALEMAAEATYPVPEVVTTGLMLITSQLFTVLFIICMQAGATIVPASPLQTCGPGAIVKDYSIPNLVTATLLSIWSICQLFFMNLPYRRRDAELSALNLLPHTEITIENSV